MSDFYRKDINDGTAQSERFPRALEPGYFAIDEMGLEQLLVLGKRLAENLKYYDLNGEWDGSAAWEDLFADDPAFILADIANTDTSKLEIDYRIRTAKQSKSVRAQAIYLLVEKIERWRLGLHVSGQPQIVPITAEIEQIIAKTLAEKLDRLFKVLKSDEGTGANKKLQAIKAVWDVIEAKVDEIPNNDKTKKPYKTDKKKELPKPDQLLDETFHHFVGVINYIRTIAGANLDPAVAKSDQNPAISLYIAFLKLYRRVQDAINKFPTKRLDFYFKKLLGSVPQSRQADKVNLALTLAPGQPPATVPRGTAFLAGKDEADRDIIFNSDEDLYLTDASVQVVRTIFLDHDKLISPQNELAIVTRMMADEVDISLGSDVGSPLFGAGASSTSREAEVGLAIASPLLHLREGERRITIDIECENARPSDANDEEVLPADSQKAAELLAELSNPTTPECSGATATDHKQRFSQRLGQVLARELMSSAAWLTEPAKSLIRAAVRQVHGEDSAADHLLSLERTALFYRVFRDALAVRLTTEEGWSLRDYVIKPIAERRGESIAGLRLELSLSSSDPAIVAYDREMHGGDYSTDQPIISLQVNPESMYYAYSLFTALDIRNIALKVDVCGARAMVAYGELGQLDPSKPFVPFGPMPSRDSYLVIGNYEAAGKPLKSVSVDIEWGALPREFGGFEQYYNGYSADYSAESFKVETSIMVNGDWVNGEADYQSLFTTVDETGQVAPGRRLDLLRGRRYSEMDKNVPEEEYRLDNQARAGFFRLGLGPSKNAFGHAEYPQLLTSVLMANAKRRKPLPIPRQPYTPMTNKLSLDYTAQATIRIRSDSQSGHVATGNKLFHQHPFGIHELEQSGRDRPIPLMPRFRADGYLLLGLDSSGPPGTISLLFELCGGTRKITDEPLKCNWLYLSDNEVRPLGRHAIQRDTTGNFTYSGIITIELPDDITRDNTVLDGRYYWIAIAARGDLRLCPRVSTIKSGALRVIREITDQDTRFKSLARNTITEAVSAPAAIGTIEQPGDSFGGRPAEDNQRLITRTAERLHHKDRACQPWDYERLVLQQFPDIYKVKCFANMTTDDRQPAPGKVLIVVVPREKTEVGQRQQLMVNRDRLGQIKHYLEGKSSVFADVVVRNAVYELIQIRCAVKLAGAHRAGRNVRQLQQEISDFISPWRPNGNGANFGWCIRRKDIESHIAKLDYVEFVTDFSMLHITQKSNQSFCLQDTARPIHKHYEDAESEVLSHADEINPRYPWSLALPSRQHYIEIISDVKDRNPQPTGVGELEVGNTMILDAGDGRG